MRTFVICFFVCFEIKESKFVIKIFYQFWLYFVFVVFDHPKQIKIL